MTRRSLSCRLVLILMLLLAFPGLVPAADVFAQAPGPADTVQRAIAYLASQQIDGGGIDSFASGAADPTGTALTVLALAAIGEQTAIPGLTEYLAEGATAYTHQSGKQGPEYLFPSRAGLLLAAVSAADGDPHDVGGMDLLGELELTLDESSGAYASQASEEFTSGAASDVNQSWALLGLASAGVPVPASAVDYLLGLQAADGSWAAGDPDTTARSLVGVLASGQLEPTDPAVESAVAWFRSIQLANGGWRPAWDTEPLNADTTGWVIQALVAAGYTPVAASFGATEGDPLSALAGLQQKDGQIGGAYANAYSTAEALLGLSGRPVTTLGRAGRVARALSWLASRQDASGAWAGLSGLDAGATAEALLAFAAAGVDPAALRTEKSNPSALDYVISAVADGYALTSPAAAGKVTVALVASGADATDVGGANLRDVLATEWYSPTISAFGTISDTVDTWAQSWAILGLAAAGGQVPAAAVDALIGLQQPGGNWFDAWGFSPVDSTGLVLQALASAGRTSSDESVAAAVAFLKKARDSAGGWENANSTATAIQGLLAAGEDVTSDAWRIEGKSPLDALAALQKVDGPFVWMWENPYGPAADDVLATSQAIPALLGTHYPLSATQLGAFRGVPGGPDPDRLVLQEPRSPGDGALSLAAAYGSDANRDGTLALDYRPLGVSDWITGTAVTRSEGTFAATLALSDAAAYEVRVTVSDADGVQYAGAVRHSVEFLLTREATAPTPSAADLDIGAWVGLVVRLDDDRTEVLSVPFQEGMNGIDLLTDSGLDVTASYAPMGATVCAIEGQGCAADDCFCESPNTWSYWQLQDGKWVYSPVGASAYQVKSGDVQGWSWGNAAPPPLLPMETIFAAALEPQPTAEPTTSPAATGPATAEAALTPTVAPEATPAGTPTAVYYAVGGLLALILVGAFIVPRLRRRR